MLTITPFLKKPCCSFSTDDRSLINPAEVNDGSICVLQLSEPASLVLGHAANGTVPFRIAVVGNYFLRWSCCCQFEMLTKGCPLPLRYLNLPQVEESRTWQKGKLFVWFPASGRLSNQLRSSDVEIYTLHIQNSMSKKRRERVNHPYSFQRATRAFYQENTLPIFSYLSK